VGEKEEESKADKDRPKKKPAIENDKDIRQKKEGKNAKVNGETTDDL